MKALSLTIQTKRVNAAAESHLLYKYLYEISSY